METIVNAKTQFDTDANRILLPNARRNLRILTQIAKNWNDQIGHSSGDYFAFDANRK